MKRQILRLLRWIISALPTPVGYALAGLIGDLTYHLTATSRRISFANMNHVLGSQASPARLERTVRAVFRNNVRNYYELCRLPRLPLEQIMRMTTVREEDWAKLVNPVRQGQGVVIATAHFGSFEMVSQVLTGKGLDASFLIAYFEPRYLSEYITALRSSQGLHLVETTPATLLQSVRDLKKGRIVGILADRNVEQKGITLPFFGDPAVIPTGPARLAMQAKAVILPIFCVRLSNKRYSVEIGDPIQPTRTDDSDADSARIMSQVIASYEQHIGAHPSQWVLFKPVWAADQHLLKKADDGEVKSEK